VDGTLFSCEPRLIRGLTDSEIATLIKHLEVATHPRDCLVDGVSGEHMFHRRHMAHSTGSVLKRLACFHSQAVISKRAGLEPGRHSPVRSVTIGHSAVALGLRAASQRCSPKIWTRLSRAVHELGCPICSCGSFSCNLDWDQSVIPLSRNFQCR
jgi:hypothetical protein